MTETNGIRFRRSNIAQGKEMGAAGLSSLLFGEMNETDLDEEILECFVEIANKIFSS